jgi:hypothetical protein
MTKKYQEKFCEVQIQINFHSESVYQCFVCKMMFHDALLFQNNMKMQRKSLIIYISQFDVYLVIIASSDTWHLSNGSNT